MTALNFTSTTQDLLLRVVPGRYANRIANGTFSLEGKECHLSVNEGSNTLHGGKDGFDRRNWTGREVPGGVEFTLVSPDGDKVFRDHSPHTCVTHSMGTVAIHYTRHDRQAHCGQSDQSYLFQSFRRGQQNHILNEKLTIFADKMTPVDSNLIPKGELKPVAGTPFDFTHAETIGARINADDEQLKLAHGYDHNWVLNGYTGTLHPAARVYDPASGRVLMEIPQSLASSFTPATFLMGHSQGRTASTISARVFVLKRSTFRILRTIPRFRTLN